MRRSAVVISVCLTLISLTGCGQHSPSAPTAVTSSGVDAAIEATVKTMVAETTSLVGATLPTPNSPVFTTACPSGGTVTTTFLNVPPSSSGSGPLSVSARSDYNDCRSPTSILRGDPAIFHTTTMEVSGVGSGAATSGTLTATTKTTGGLLIESASSTLRVRFDCGSTMVTTLGSLGLPQIRWSGTITWESPLGAPPRTTSCGPV